MKGDGLNEVFDFFQDCESYLHSWLCTKDGEYKLYDTNSVRTVLFGLLSHGSTDLIDEFENGVETGRIMIRCSSIILPEKKRSLLYEHHLGLMRNFEKKYLIKNEKK